MLRPRGRECADGGKGPTSQFGELALMLMAALKGQLGYPSRDGMG